MSPVNVPEIFLGEMGAELRFDVGFGFGVCFIFDLDFNFDFGFDAADLAVLTGDGDEICNKAVVVTFAVVVIEESCKVEDPKEGWTATSAAPSPPTVAPDISRERFTTAVTLLCSMPIAERCTTHKTCRTHHPHLEWRKIGR